jgi:hypothetical protein
MWRLHSTFADRRTDCGLALFRLALVTRLFFDAARGLGSLEPLRTVCAVGEVLAGALVLVGLRTPAAGTLSGLIRLAVLAMAGVTGRGEG